MVKIVLERPGKARGKVEIELYCFFNLGASWGWMVNGTPMPLYPREKDPVTEGRVGPRADLDGCGKSRPHRDSIPRPFRP